MEANRISIRAGHCVPYSLRPIDMLATLQRTGRTGRHKEGKVVYILAAGGEEAKYKRGLQVGVSTHVLYLMRPLHTPYKIL